MPDNPFMPLAEFDGVPPSSGGFGAGGGGVNPPAGGGLASLFGATSAPADAIYARPGARRRPMGPAGSPGVMGPSPNDGGSMGIDPHMVAMVAQFFAHHFSGGQGGPTPSGQGGPPQPGLGGFQGPQIGSGGLPVFDQGGVVTRPTLGWLGMNGRPEAVVPLGGGGVHPFGAGPGPNMDPNNPSQWIGGGGINGPSGAQSGYGYGQWNAYQPDPRITEMLRSQAIRDAQSRDRANRLGLVGDASVDPSTYGFQALMSSLLGQQDVQNTLTGATSQQALAAQQFGRNAELARLSNKDKGFDWMGLAQGIGTLAGGFG